MKEINVLLSECSDRFSETEEFRILKTYRTRDNRLSFDERLSIVKCVERTYAPFFDLMKADAPTLTDSDLIFCALSVQRVERVAIAECLTVSTDAVRMRKLRLREKLPSKWFETIFPEQRRNSSESVTPQTAIKPEAGIPLLAESKKNTNAMKEKLSFGKAVASCFRNYLTLKGRARRSEYWYFVLFCFIVMMSLDIFSRLFSNVAYPTMSEHTQDMCEAFFNSLGYVIKVGLLFPTFSVTVRRLHDRDDNGWVAVLICLLPWLFNMVFIILARKYAVLLSDETAGLTSNDIGFLAAFFTFLIVNQIVLIVKIVVFSKVGTEGPNSYGPDPVRIIADPANPDSEMESQADSVMKE